MAANAATAQQPDPARRSEADSKAKVSEGKVPSTAPIDQGLSPEEKSELEEMLAIVQDFQEQTKSYNKEVQQIVESKYEEQKTTVVSSYNRAISDLEKEETQRRLDAIEVFESFLTKYPDDPGYTPSALWRLAELYYEKSKLDYTKEEEAYEQAMAEFNRGERKLEPTPAAPHFERTVSLLQRLIRDFPDYKLIDGTFYLLAYCLQEQGETEEAQEAYLAFTTRFPNSKFIPEVWTRLGESYFEDPDKLEAAIDAYRQVLSYPKSQMFDKALYKLAWTYYKVDRFQEAVERFDQLITWADSRESVEGEVSSTELRKEAMQYLAISFAEDEWAGSGVENASAFFRRSGGRSYDGEFFRRLGETYYVDAKYDKCVAAYQEAIRRYPLDPANPSLMSSIVEAHYRLQQPEKAIEAQEELVKAFGPGSKWRIANKDVPEVLLQADKLAETALYTAAVRHHTLAQRLKEQKQPEEARREYEKAAEIYADYLKRFTDSRDAYKLTYYLAECHYYALNIEKAAETYALVRDSSAGTEFLAESANSVVLAYLNLSKEAEAAGKLEPLKVYTSKDRPKDLAVKEKPIPPLRAKLIEACDTYVAKLPADEQAGNMAFRAARILYAYDHFDEARERFSRIVSEAKENDLVTSSINLIIESYLVSQDWPQVEAWSQKLAILSRDPLQKKVLREFELGARFNNATEMMTTGKKMMDEGQQEEAQAKLDAAASEFIRLVNDDSSGKNSDKALNNAALCYTWSKRPVSAGKIYERIVREYPRSTFADKALLLMAASAESSYQFQLAIDNYLKLVDEYPKSEFRPDALYNAAVALEGDQQYLRAAKAYERYAALFKDRPDAPENFFRAGLMLEKQKAWEEMIALFGRFMHTYHKDREQRERMVLAQMKITEARAALGEDRLVQKGYDEIIKLFKNYQLPAGGRAAEAAAKARFQLADLKLINYEKITFDVPPRKLKKILDLKAITLKKMEEIYKSVFDFKRVEWTLAAYFRLGYLYENFADVLVNAPCPKDLNQEECDIYKVKLADYAEAPIKKAVTAYEETMNKSKEFKVVNEWTKKAYLGLNRFEPLKYLLQKEPESVLVVDRHGPLPLLRTAEKGIKPSGK